MPKEYCEIISKAKMGLQVGPKNGMYGKHRTEQEKQKLRECHSKPIRQYDLNNNFIKEYKSAKEAAEAVGSKSQSKLGDCAKGKLKTAYGYV